MYFMEDENFAKQLQHELQAFENFKHLKENNLNESLNPVDSKLEYVDPTPSIHDLFVKFDRKFFWNKLGMVEVVWSHRMTKCAGLCSFEGGRGLCKIALSAPLLSLRPRKDLVETLLHEMIHAYLFVTHNFKDREDHGPEFHKHMFRINKEAGTKITVYHTFFDEVEYYQRHIWRCDGPCQKKKPYFGFVRRAVNRPPGPNDPWWNQHKMQCGGTFTKISEPEKKVKNGKKVMTGKPGEKHKDIREYFNKNKTDQNIFKNKTTSNIKTLADVKGKTMGGVKANIGTGTIVVTNINRDNKSKSKSPNSQNSRKNKNSVNKKDSETVKTSKESGIDTSKDSNTKTTDLDCNVRQTVRNIWANKFSNSKPKESPSPKKVKLQCPVCNEGFSEEEIQNHVDECLDGKNNTNHENSKPEATCDKSDEYKICSVCSEKILESEMNDHLESCLNCTFVNEGEDEIKCESVPCPCCYKWFKESEMNSHIDECLTLNTLKEEILGS